MKESSPFVSCRDSGLIIHSNHHWLAASPDGLINDPNSVPSEGLVEIKCPHKVKDLAISEAAKTVDFCLKLDENQTAYLKKNHNYYYQIQCAMFCTERAWCDFVV